MNNTALVSKRLSITKLYKCVNITLIQNYCGAFGEGQELGHINFNFM